MKNKIRFFAVGIFAAMTLTACGRQNTEMEKFKTDMDSFCTTISKIDTSINNIDAESESAIDELLGYLDELDVSFQGFAEMDFPKEFDYLENLADESGSYMTEAVASYHDLYEDEYYDAGLASYAKENYSRAYKRVQIIITFLHGEEPEDVDLTIAPEEESAETEGTEVNE